MIEVDLLDQDGVIISIAAVDETFWGNYAVASDSLAASRGLAIFVPGGLNNQPSRNVYSWDDMQNWVSSAVVGTTKRAGAPPSGGNIVAVVVVGAVAVGLLVLGVRLL